MTRNLSIETENRRTLFVSAVTIVSVALLLDLYCYAGEFSGFYGPHSFDLSGVFGMDMMKLQRGLINYTYIVSMLSFGASFIIRRGHRAFSIFGYHVSGALFVWSCMLPRF